MRLRFMRLRFIKGRFMRVVHEGGFMRAGSWGGA